MKLTKRWTLATMLICVMMLVSSFSDDKEGNEACSTDDTSLFVAISDVIPDAIMDHR